MIPVLYIITHTETYDNRRRIFSGHRDSRLTPKGLRQARVLAQKLKNKKVAIAFISPLRRSYETLKVIMRHHPQLEIIRDKRLTERGYGRLSGKSKTKYRLKYPRHYQIYHRSYKTPPPGGESMVSVEKRVRSFLKDALVLMKKRKISGLVVAHNNSIRPLRRYFEKLTSAEMMTGNNYNQIFAYRLKL